MSRVRSGTDKGPGFQAFRSWRLGCVAGIKGFGSITPCC